MSFKKRESDSERLVSRAIKVENATWDVKGSGLRDEVKESESRDNYLEYLRTLDVLEERHQALLHDALRSGY
jgi:hypothetical protein